MNVPHGGSASDWSISFPLGATGAASATAYISNPISYNAPGSRPSDGLHGHSSTTTPCPRIEFCTYPRESAQETVANMSVVFVIAGVIFLATGRTLSRAVHAWVSET